MRARYLFPLLATTLLATACADSIPTGTMSSVSRMSSIASCDIGVTTAEALTLIDDLIAEVNALETSGDLTAGQANALRNHLENARRHLEAGRPCPALAQLRAFREQVQNFVADGVLTAAEATPLLEGIDDIIMFNVALNKGVTLVGTYGVLAAGDPWLPTSLPPAAGATITDGAFLTEMNDWHRNTVWWDALQAVSSANRIDVDLGGTFAVTRFVAQVDNNDYYQIAYRRPDGTWAHGAWIAPVAGWGMMTRQHTFVMPIMATALWMRGAGGDGYYSASELQAWGREAP